MVETFRAAIENSLTRLHTLLYGADAPLYRLSRDAKKNTITISIAETAAEKMKPFIENLKAGDIEFQHSAEGFSAILVVNPHAVDKTAKAFDHAALNHVADMFETSFNAAIKGLTGVGKSREEAVRMALAASSKARATLGL